MIISVCPFLLCPRTRLKPFKAQCSHILYIVNAYLSLLEFLQQAVNQMSIEGHEKPPADLVLFFPS